MKGILVFAAAASFILYGWHAQADGMKGTEMKEAIRQPSVAGQFYTGNPDKLRKEIEQMISLVPDLDVPGRVIALVSPHAGYIYSGMTAAHGYSLLDRGQYESVVVISPCHVDLFPYSSVFAGGAYRTPLGDIAVDRELVDLIAKGSSLVRADTRGHLYPPGARGEHSLEVQLPFLQTVLGEFKLVAIVMGDQSSQAVEELGKALARSLEGRKALIVASTDLSHFHEDAGARRLDNVFIEGLRRFDHESLLRSISAGNTEACGGGPTAAAMMAARMLGADECRLLNYSNSGDITGDDRSVVGYASAVFLDVSYGGDKRDSEKEESGGEEVEGDISDSDRLFLLRYARRVLETGFSGEDIDMDIPSSNILREKRGGFVTLKKNGQLRGCIGYIEAVKPLIDTVAEMAEAAAFHDRRFSPLRKKELDEITVEISVLSPIRRIDDPSLIEVGRHGIIITRDGYRGLLLPQVATEWNWDRETFLGQTCVKAGLDPIAWKKPGTVIEIFSAEIFSETEMGLR